MNGRVFWAIGSAVEAFLYSISPSDTVGSAFCGALAVLFALLAVMPSEKS